MKKVFFGLFVFIAFSVFADENKKGYFDVHEQGWHRQRWMQNQIPKKYNEVSNL